MQRVTSAGNVTEINQSDGNKNKTRTKREQTGLFRLKGKRTRRGVAVKLDPLTEHLLFRPTDSERVLSTMC